MKNRHALVGVVGLLTLTAPVLAHDGDVGIRVNNGRLETVLASGEPPAQSFGTEVERVFAVEWAFNALTNDVRIDEPGLASADAALLGQTLGLNIRAALRRWDGSGFVPTAFSAGVGGGDLELDFINTPATDTAVTGHSIVVPEIPLDFHYDWRLNGATETAGLGIYLVEVELTNPGGSLLTSDPIWFVFNYGQSEEEHQAAIEYAAENLVPSPGAAAIGLLGALTLRRRR